MSRAPGQITFTRRPSPMPAAALLCLALGTGMVYYAATDEAPAGVSQSILDATRSSHEGAALDFGPKAALISPFGESPRATLDTSTSLPTIQQGAEEGSPLGLRLMAVLISPFGESPRATLDTGTSQLTIQQGEEVLPGVRLAEVLADRVVLARGPRRDVLMLDAQEVAATVPPTPAEASVPTPAPVAAWGTLVSHGGGVLVQSSPTLGIGRELDLVQGDKIVRVNGIAVTQAPDVEAAVSRLAGDTTIQIDGVRNGKPIRLFYSSRRTAPDDDTATSEE